MEFSPKTYHRFSVAAFNAVIRVIEALVAQGHTGEANKGGYCRLFRLEKLGGGPESLVPVFEGWVGGEANIERIKKYEILSFEKAVRLVTGLADDGGMVVSSFQYRRDPNRGRYGGAILLQASLEEGSDQVWLILSFSGLPELADEATMLLLASTMWTINTNVASKVIRASGNCMAESLLARV